MYLFSYRGEYIALYVLAFYKNRILSQRPFSKLLKLRNPKLVIDTRATKRNPT
jgi:hypothetical protein